MMISSAVKARGPRVISRNVQKLRYSSEATNSLANEVHSKPVKKSFFQSFDKTMYYPAILLILFGSQVINVINSQRSVEDMERRYTLKMAKVDELKERLLQGEKNIDIRQELELINKMFLRFETNGENKLRFDGYASVKGHNEQRGNNVGIIEDFDDDKLNELFGLVLENDVKPEQPKKEKKETKIEDGLQNIDRDLIREQITNEKELVNYKLNPELHVIVEKPGDYNESAKDTKVPKFL